MHRKSKKDYSNLIGKVYPDTKWIVNSTIFHKKEVHVHVTCICGNKSLVKFRNLKTGRTKSCGKCSPRNIAKKLGNRTYQSDYSCPKGHIGLRRTDNGACVECSYEYKRQKRKDPEYWQYECELSISYQKEKSKDPEWLAAKAKKQKDRYHIKMQTDSDYVENRRKYCREYMSTSEIGQLRKMCNYTSKKLSLGSISYSKLDILEYTPNEFINHLLIDYPQFETLEEAHKADMHKDHICPLHHIVNHIDDIVLRFKIAMDIKNIRLMPKKKNRKKWARIDLPEVQEAIKYLNQKYNVNMPLE